MHLLVEEFGLPEVTVCGRQGAIIQLLTKCKEVVNVRLGWAKTVCWLTR